MRKLAAVVAAVVLVVAVPGVAGAQNAPTVSATCAGDQVTVTWSGGPSGAAGARIILLGGGVTQDEDITSPAAAGSRTFTRTISALTGTVTMQFGAASQSEAASWDCTPTPVAAGNEDVVAAVALVEAAVGRAVTAQSIANGRLSDIETAVQTATTRLTGIEAAVADLEARDGQRVRQLAQVVENTWETRQAAETARNQLRHQTHALLVLVALIFALWLRPVFRSRNEVS